MDKTQRMDRAESAGFADALPLVRRLCDALADQRVAYCHWKSTTQIDRSYRGENDLDLLIARRDAQRFEEVAAHLGFKLALARRELPGVLDYYGLDESVGRLVHLHAHYRLAVGDDLTKNVVLPVEDQLIEASTATAPGFPVPPRELELLLLVIRLTLKHNTWDAMIMRRGRISGSARAELEDLQSGGSPADGDVPPSFLPAVTRELREECERALEAGAGFWQRARAGRRMTAALRAEARRAPTVDVVLKAWRQGLGVLRLRKGGKRLGSGGLLVAIVGADGAGKTTLVASLHTWLRSAFTTVDVHLGKPPASFSTRVLRGVLLVRAAARRVGGRRERDPGFLDALSSVRLAADRRRAFTAARGLAAGGAIVICDRFPVREITLMDAPRIRRWVTDDAGRLLTWLHRREEDEYRRIARPDVLFVLRIDPEVAVARRTDEDPDYVRRRNREVFDADWSSSGAVIIDAGQSAEDVLTTVREHLWNHL